MPGAPVSGVGAGLEGLATRALCPDGMTQSLRPQETGGKPGGVGGGNASREEEISSMSFSLPTVAQVAFYSIVLESFCSVSWRV